MAAAAAAEGQYFMAVAEFCPMPLWVLDLSGHVEFANRLATPLGGTAHAAPWRDRWPEDAHVSVERAIAGAKAGRAATFRACASTPGEPRLYLEATVTPTFDEAGAVHKLLVVARDVTETVETHGFLNSVIQLLPLALTVKDLSSGQFVLANAAAEDLFGVAIDRFSGAMASDIRSQEMAGLHDRIDQSHDGAERCRTTWEAPCTAGQPNCRKMTTTRVTTFDDNGPRHMIALTEDVTEQVSREDSLARALDEAELGRRAQSAFLANISHEIRTPLNGLLAAVDLLRSQGLSQLAAELVEIIGSSSQALERRLQDLLDVAYLDCGRVSLNASTFDPGQLIGEAVSAASSAAEAKGLAIRGEIAPGTAPTVIGDRSRLRQALDQLIDNAIKFTDQGEVLVAVEKIDDGQLRFSIVDTGRGFDPRLKASLFDRFLQEESGLSRRQGGCGLGLSLAADLVRLMGGGIDCALRPDGGAVFWIDLSLPIAAVTAPACGAGHPVGEPPWRILLADDHPANRRVVELVLGDMAKITPVADGHLAVEAFMREDFDLVLMDIQMPQLDGVAAVHQIRRWEAAVGRARTPIAMLTANTGDEHVQASRTAGADRHITKPFTAAILMHSVLEMAKQKPSVDAAESEVGRGLSCMP